MHHLHTLAHGCYDDRCRRAEREVRFLAESGLLGATEPPARAQPGAAPRHGWLGLPRLLGLARPARQP